jgi:Flp pilus assembly protein TadD
MKKLSSTSDRISCTPIFKAMKNIFALVSVSTLLFQVLTVEMVSAQTAPQVKQIAQADLSSAKAYRDRGFSKSDAGDQQGAIADFDRSIQLDPNDGDTYAGRGLAKFMLKDKQGAINDITTSTELHRQQGNMATYQKGLKIIEQLKASLDADRK